MLINASGERPSGRPEERSYKPLSQESSFDRLFLCWLVNIDQRDNLSSSLLIFARRFTDTHRPRETRRVADAVVRTPHQHHGGRLRALFASQQEDRAARLFCFFPSRS